MINALSLNDIGIFLSHPYKFLDAVESRYMDLGHPEAHHTVFVHCHVLFLVGMQHLQDLFKKLKVLSLVYVLDNLAQL